MGKGNNARTQPTLLEICSMPDYATRLIMKAFRRATAATLGKYRSMLRRTTFIAVTGSAGKTTAKELINAILSSRYKGTYTRGTMNALTPLCKTMLKVRPWHKYCIMEMGTSGKGCIREYTRYFPPDIGVVLSVGLDHYTEFRSIESIAAEKQGVVEAIPSRGTAILNADDSNVAAMADAATGNIVRFGHDDNSDFRVLGASSAWPDRLTLTLKSDGELHHIRTRLFGTVWVPSILAAWAVGRTMQIPDTEIARILEQFEPFPGRMSVVSHPDGVTWIRDDWKSPYWSIQHVIDFMRDARAKRKIMVFGTISDTPGSTPPKYRTVAGKSLEVADLVIFVGRNAHYAVKPGEENIHPSLKMFDTALEASTFLDSELRYGDLVLLKGSIRSDHIQRLYMNREKTVKCWKMDCGRMMSCYVCPLLYRES